MDLYVDGLHYRGEPLQAVRHAASHQKQTKVTSAGDKTTNKVTSFTDGTWATDLNAPYETVTAVKTTYTWTKSGVNVVLTTYLVKDTTTVTINGTDYTVPKNTLKWTIDISGWTFLDTANSLQFILDIHTSKNDGSVLFSLNKKQTNHHRTLSPFCAV